MPRVTKVCFRNTSAVSEPRTTAATTATFAGFQNDAALEANETERHCRDSCFERVENGQAHEETNNIMKVTISVSKHAHSVVHLRLTFAGLHALKPAVIHVLVASTSTILVPSTARSATTDSPRSLECAAVWAYTNAHRGGRR